VPDYHVKNHLETQINSLVHESTIMQYLLILYCVVYVEKSARRCYRTYCERQLPSVRILLATRYHTTKVLSPVEHKRVNTRQVKRTTLMPAKIKYLLPRNRKSTKSLSGESECGEANCQALISHKDSSTKDKLRGDHIHLNRTRRL
jgi:hypothetical protein